MTKVQSQIKSIAKNLETLANKLEKLNAQLNSAPAKKAAPPKRAAAKPKAAAKKKAPAKRKVVDEGKGTVLDSVLDVISRSRTGANIANLKEKTGLESRQLSNALYKLSKKGQIKTISRGVYVKA